MCTFRIWATHPREALCDWGIWGCRLHKESGWFPWWNRKELDENGEVMW